MVRETWDMVPRQRYQDNGTKTTALPSGGVLSSVRYSLCLLLRQWGIFIGWTIFGVTIVRMVTFAWINREYGLFTCVLCATLVTSLHIFVKKLSCLFQCYVI